MNPLTGIKFLYEEIIDKKGVPQKLSVLIGYKVKGLSLHNQGLMWFFHFLDLP